MKLSKKIIFPLFFASGISGLIYEVVWLRIASRITGHTTYATSIILAVFMIGLGLGSFLFGKFIDKRKDHLKIYALLELLTGVSALLVTWILNEFFPIYKFLFQISGQNIGLGIVIRTIILFICILLPTILMGGTLPVLSSYMIKRKDVFGKNFSLLYGLNTFGAAIGVILSGFVTIGSIGEWNTILIAAIINLFVAVVADFIFITKNIYPKTNLEETTEISQKTLISPYSNFIRRMVLILFLISGFTALAYEVIWSRQLILFLKTSIYAFSGMLALFLIGIALGSIFMNRFVDNLKRPLIIFGGLEIIVGILSILNLYLFRFLDKIQILSGHFIENPLAAVILVFPLAFLFGAIFPVASLCYTKSVNTVGSSVGKVYGFNTMGSILGALVAGFVFIPLLGSSQSVIILVFVNIIFGLFILWLESIKPFKIKLEYLAISIVALSVAIFSLIVFRRGDPLLSVIEKRIAIDAQSHEIFYNKEGTEGTVTCFSKDGQKGLLINGEGQTGLLTETKLMAHLPIMLAENPKEILVICFGMGTTVRSASIYENLNITSVELVPEVRDCFEYYHKDAKEILKKKNINFIVEDGRNFLLFFPKKYDVITIDPSPPIYSAGTVNLYTQEFFSLCREHLNPGGIVSLWFPGSSIEEENRYILKTFYQVFPNMTVWSGPHKWGIYLIGALGPAEIDKTKIENAFNDPKLVKDLSEYDDSCITSEQLLNLFLWNASQVEYITRNTLIVSDNFPYTEFPLWRYLSHGK